MDPIFNYPELKPVKKSSGFTWLMVFMSLLAVCAIGCSIWFSDSFDWGAAATQTPGQTPGLSATNRPPSATPGNPAATLPPVAGNYSLETIYDYVGPAVVTVNNYQAGRGGELTLAGLGSGVVIFDNGYIITNCHVVEDAYKLTVVFSDEREYDAELVGSDTRGDIAVLKVDRTDLTAAVIGDSSTLRVGEMVCAIGSPDGLAGTLTVGYISGPSRYIVKDSSGATIHVLQTDTAINPGNSGGALLNSRGELVGIPTLKTLYVGSVSAEGLGFCIPINDAMRIAGELIEKGYYSRAVLGVTVSNVTETQIAGGMVRGCYVEEVSADSAASKGGIKKGDIITEFNGKKTETQTKLSEAMADCRPGETAEITVSRSGETLKITVVLQEMR